MKKLLSNPLMKSILVSAATAALQALIQALAAHHVDPVPAGTSGLVAGAAYAARSPYFR